MLLSIVIPYFNAGKLIYAAVQSILDLCVQDAPYEIIIINDASEYYNNRCKAVILAVIGTEPIEKGVRIAAAHIDSPRLDLKQCPLYEDNEMAMFKTHYYGGIKKYQWTAIPLSLHGVIVRSDNTKVTVNIGEDANDPVFCVAVASTLSI